MTNAVENFKHVFTHLDASNIGMVDTLYDNNVTFIDPFNEIRGLERLRHYLHELYKNVISCEFQFGETFVKDNSAMLVWKMRLSHRTLARTRPVELSGSSMIQFNDKIYFHRDYFDGGQLVYEQLPLIGYVIRFIKKQV